MKKRYSLLSALAICGKHAPLATAVYVAAGILNGALPPLMVYVVAAFIDSAVVMVSGGAQAEAFAADTLSIWLSALLMFLGYAYNQISYVLQSLSEKSIETRLRSQMRPLMVKKQASLDFACVESADTLDLIAFVNENMESRMLGILRDCTTALQVGVQLAGMLAILAAYVWWLPPALLFGAIPPVLVSYRGGSALVEKDREISALTRMMYYVSGVLSGREAAAERSLFGFTEGVNEKFKALHRKRSNLNTELIARWELRAKLCGLALLLFVLAAMAALAGGVSDGSMTSGAYIAVAGAMINLARVLTGSLSHLVFSVSEHIGYMKAFSSFWSLKGDEAVLTHAPIQMVFERLEVKDLRFKYQSQAPADAHASSDYVLKGVNLTMEKGRTYSLIGRNGAGKTTLTKILTGLYRDFEGEVKINGRDIRAYSMDELRGLFSVVYQDYARYDISLRDNIVFGGKDDGFDELMEAVELKDVVDKLSSAADTPLGRVLENGTDVSGGEWQKIAIARAMHRDCPFIILDEPTASLSPMMESKVYRQFAALAADHTQLLISHRLGSTKLADTLLVLHDGRIAESGTHHELMAAGGLYAGMFEGQRSWYNEDE